MNRSRAALVAFLLLAGCTGGGDTGGTGGGSASDNYVRGLYEGPAVSFEYPEDWHEFFLSAGAQFMAAYGPASGGDADYVAIFPGGSIGLDEGQDPADFLEAMIGDDGVGPVESVDVNGLAGYSVQLAYSGADGEPLQGRAIVVIGERANYFIACQHTSGTESQVLVGCQRLMDTLVETQPPVEDPSRCTEFEESLLESVSLPDGSTMIKQPAGLTSGGGHACDLMAEPTSQDRDDVFDHFRSGLTDGGWLVEGPRLDRTAVELEVWQMVAVRDWDRYLIEAYVDGEGAVQHFFVTVADG